MSINWDAHIAILQPATRWFNQGIHKVKDQIQVLYSDFVFVYHHVSTDIR